MTKFWDMELETKPDFVDSMKRVYAWYDHEIIDRVPVRFSAHNAEYNIIDDLSKWNTLEERWFDVEYQVGKFVKSLEHSSFLGETFPMFFPNLGPNYYGATMGGELIFGDVTSWLQECVEDESDLDKIYFRKDSKYYKKMMELMNCAFDQCKNKFMVGYTDMHSGMDVAAGFRGSQNLCLDLYDDPEFVDKLLKRCTVSFNDQMREFDKMLKDHNQVSVTWMNIPSYEGMHIPSCDFGAMISKDFFNEFELPYIKDEISLFKHNIFHLDGAGVAKHLDILLELDEIQAIQWVQGMGLNIPIMQWCPLIKKIQDAGRSVVVDLQVSELDDFMDAMSPKGIYLCISESEPEIQKQILNKLLKWK